MPHPYWPLFDLRVRTPRLKLRLPTDEDLVGLARVAAAGVHAAAEMPFSTPWTLQPSPELERGVIQWHWRCRGDWTPARWHADLGVWWQGELVGAQGVLAADFAATRSVSTGSWLGRASQGKGIGKELRAAVLHLAFAGLGAAVARSGAFEDNPASVAVSRALGYFDDGDEEHVRRGVAARLLRFKLTRERWEATRRPDVEVEGLEPCLPLFGAAPSA